MSMRRRDFMTGAAVVAVLPRPARAQPRDRARRIGMLLLFAEGDPEAQVRVKAFAQGLRELDWREGDNTNIEYRFAAGDFNRMRAFAKELVKLKPDVIVTNSIQPIIAVWRQTRTIPIVFAMSPDPVDAGLIKSLSHPEETITGFTTFEYAIVGKWLELLKAIAPRVTRVGLMFNPDAYDRTLYPPRGNWMDWFRQLEAFAPSFAIDHIAVPVRNFVESETALADFARRPDGGLLVATDPFTVGNYRHLVGLALRHQLPACYPYRYFATEGGLMSYGPNGAAMFRQAASYVDRIPKGANPGDLPIQRPNKFEFVLNLKTARALGLDVPRSLLVRADEVIE
jgi:putative tryptophan/tyrosine transport system substrate-binding protein